MPVFCFCAFACRGQALFYRVVSFAYASFAFASRVLRLRFVGSGAFACGLPLFFGCRRLLLPRILRPARPALSCLLYSPHFVRLVYSALPFCLALRADLPCFVGWRFLSSRVLRPARFIFAFLVRRIACSCVFPTSSAGRGLLPGILRPARSLPDRLFPPPCPRGAARLGCLLCLSCIEPCGARCRQGIKKRGN